MDSTGTVFDANRMSGADRITYQWAGTLSDVTFTNNIFSTYYGFHLDENCVLANCTLLNNVFANVETPFLGGSLSGCVAASNYFASASTASIDGTNTFDHNAFRAGDTVSATDFAVTDPMLDSDCRPQSGSPLIAAGSSTYIPARDIEGKLRGAPADVGAYALSTVLIVDASAAAPGDGSESAPFPTIAQAVAAASSGTTIVIRAGVYDEPLYLANVDGLIIRGEGSVRVTGSTSVSWGSEYECALGLDRAENIEISNIAFEYAPASPIEYGSVMISVSSSVTLKNCTLTGGANASSCVQPDTNSRLTLIANTLGGETKNGIWALWSMNNAYIANNVVTNEYGLNVACPAGYPSWQGELQNNTIVNNTFAGAFASSAESHEHLINNTIANNIFGAPAVGADNEALNTANTFAANCYAAASDEAAGKPLAATEFAADPLFEAGGYTLGEGSPCAGRADASYLPETDFAGSIRRTADVGAYAYAYGDANFLYVTSKSPTGQSVWTTSDITVTFSAPVTLSAFDAPSYITVTQDGTAVPGKYSVSGQTVTFTPDSLDYETAYTVTVRAGVASADGLALAADVSWSFTTEKAAEGPREYYVAPDGDDANPGTIDQPIRTASILIDKLKAGDTVVFREGTYNGIFVMQYKEFDTPVTLRAYEGEEAVLTADTNDYIIFLGHVRGVRIENLTFRASDGATSPRGTAVDIVNFEQSIQTGDITVTNCRFENCSPAVRIRDVITSGPDLGFGPLEISNNEIVNDMREKAHAGINLWEPRVKDGYAKVYNNVISGAEYSLWIFGRAENFLFYNNTFLDTYDPVNFSQQFDIYPYGGAYNTSLYSPDLFHNCVFKNNIFTKPFRTQKEYETTILEAAQNNVFDYNVYASDSMTEYVTYNSNGEGPKLGFSELQDYAGTYPEAGQASLGYEAHGVYAPVAFVDAGSDAHLSGADNPAIGAAADEIVPGVPAPATDITGAPRTRSEAGAYAFDETLVFVGANDGEELGTAAAPYRTVKNAVAAGGKNITVKPGVYDEDGLTLPADAAVKPYGADGSYTLTGSVTVSGAKVRGAVFAGAAELAGEGASLESCTLCAPSAITGEKASVNACTVLAGLTVTGKDARVTNCVITGAQTAGIAADGAAGLSVWNNTFADNASDLAFTGTDAAVYNNIFSSESTTGSIDADYNCYNALTLSAGYLDTIAEPHAVKADPAFLNALNGDYRLHKLSPCAGAGLAAAGAPSTDKNGVSRTAMDIGAYALVKAENVYYVSPDGDDSASGAQNAPFRTISRAASAIRAGEQIVILEGTYAEDVTLSGKAYSQPDSFLITAENATLSGTLAISQCENVTISGLSVSASDKTALTVSGSSSVRFENGTISGASGGILARSSSVTVSGARILVSGTGLETEGSTADVTRTLFKGCAQAVRSAADSDLTVTASVFSSCAAGIESRGESDLRVINNSFWNVSGLNVDARQTAGDASELTLANNAYSRDSGTGLFVSIDKASGFLSENNLYNASADEKIASVCGDERTLEALRAGDDDTASLLGDPLYKAPAQDNFSPMRGSAVARAGRAVEGAPAVSYDGFAFDTTPDIGAYYSPYTLRTFHVCPYGIAWNWYDQAADGSWDRPFASIRDAIRAAGSSDTVLLHKGVYDCGRIDIAGLHGTEDAPVTIRGCDDPDCWYCQQYDSNTFYNHPDEPVPVDCAVLTGAQKYSFGDTTVSATSDLCLKLTDCSYVVLENLEIAGFQDCGVWIYGGEGIELRDLRLHNFDNKTNTNAGVMGVLANDAKNCVFDGLTIWDVGYTRRSQADHGIYVGGAENCVFENLVIYQAPGAGIQFYAGDNYKVHATGCVIRNCVFAECVDGLILCGVQGFRIVNNTFADSLNTDLYLDWTVTGCTFQNDLFVNGYTEGSYPFDRPATVLARHPGSGEHRITGNVFTHCLADYASALTCEVGWNRFVGFDEFLALQDGENTFTAFTMGSAKLAGTLDKSLSVSGQALSIRRDAVYAILATSGCADAGLADGAPETDITGALRTGTPDIGAYEAGEAVTHGFVSGDNAAWKRDDAYGLVFVLETPIPSLSAVTVDGNTIPDGSAAVSGDGLTLTLSAAYLRTLTLGRHALRVEYDDGWADAVFTVFRGETTPVAPSDPIPPADHSKPSTPATPATPVTPAQPSEPDTPATPVLPFTDVRESDWFYGDVAYVYAEGLMNGTGGTAFAPYDTMQRAMLVTILWRLAGCPASDAPMPFEDVQPGQYYAEAVRWAAECGIVTGRDALHFDPAAPVTREQFAAILYRYAVRLGLGYEGDWMFALTFTDADEISAYAYEPLCWMVQHGVMQGSFGLLRPAGTATRAEAAAMLHRFRTVLGTLANG
ncbi:MAG: right-handed parallel beta-helix repeat-containing protein [Eubacteriales bacterium]